MNINPNINNINDMNDVKIMTEKEMDETRKISEEKYQRHQNEKLSESEIRQRIKKFGLNKSYKSNKKHFKEEGLIEFSSEETKQLQKIAKDFIRFRERDMIGFIFIFNPKNILNSALRLEEAVGLFSYCIVKIGNINVKEGSINVSEVIFKLQRIINFIAELNLQKDIHLSSIIQYSMDKRIHENNIANKIFAHKKEIIEILNFAEQLRPFFVKPLSKNVAGVTGLEFAEIEQEDAVHDSEEDEGEEI